MNTDDISKLFAPVLSDSQGTIEKIRTIRTTLRGLDPNMEDEERLKVGMAIHRAMDGAGLNLWREWISVSGRGGWNTDELIKIWRSFHEFTGLRFAPIPVGKFVNRPAPTWLVKGVLPAKGIGMVYGASGAGKTFWVLDVMLAIAQAKRWRGRRVQGGYVIYVAAEGANGLVKRCKAFAVRNEVDLKTVNLELIPDSPNLFTGGDAASLTETICAAGGVTVVVIDTLAQVTAGANENAGEDMGKVFETLQTMQRELDCLVLVVHHAGKDTSKGARGWSGMRAALDVEIEVSKSQDGHVAKVTKLKDGEDGRVYPFKLVPVLIGKDDDGDAVTSCVVEHVEDVPKLEKPKGKLGLAIWEAIVAEDIISIEDIAPALEKSYAQGKVPRGDSIRRAVDNMMERGFIIEQAGVLTIPQSHKSPQMSVCGDVAKHESTPTTSTTPYRGVDVVG